MSQITLNSLTSFLNTSFKALLAVASICLFAVSANAAELDANGSQSKINGQTTVLVTGKSYKQSGVVESVKIALPKLFTFKTPSTMAGIDTDCTITVGFEAAPIKGEELYSTAEAVFTLKKGWKNTKAENNSVIVDVTFDYDTEESTKYTNIKFVACNDYDYSDLDESWGVDESSENALTTFWGAKTIKVRDGGETKSCITTGATISVKVDGGAIAEEVPFTIGGEQDFIKQVKDVTGEAELKLGKFKLLLKNGADTAKLIYEPDYGIKVYTDAAYSTELKNGDIFKRVAGKATIDKDLYFKVVADSVKNIGDTGLILNVYFEAYDKDNASESTYFFAELLKKDKTNDFKVTFNKSELKQIKNKTEVTGTVEFVNNVDFDIEFKVDSGYSNLKGVTFDKTVTVKEDQKKATFKVTIDPETLNYEDLQFGISTTPENAKKACILDETTGVYAKIFVTIFIPEANFFVDNTKGVVITPKQDLRVKIPFKFKKALKDDVKVNIYTSSGVTVPGTDLVLDLTDKNGNKYQQISTEKSSFNLEFKITDLAQFKAYKEQSFSFTAIVDTDYKQSGLADGQETRVVLKAREIVSKFIKADLSWTVDGKTPTDEQKKGKAVVKTDSEIQLFVKLTKNMGKNKDLESLVDSALKENSYHFTVKLDKNAQLAIGISEKEHFDTISPTDSKLLPEMPITYCAAKKIKANLTIASRTKGIKLGVKKATIQVGDELDLDPYAIPAEINDLVYKSANTYTKINFNNDDIYLKGNKAADTVIVNYSDEISVTQGAGYTKDKQATLKLYVGTGVAKNDTFSADKEFFVDEDVDTALIKVAPALSFYVCDPITNKNELKSPKKIALKAPKGQDLKPEAKMIDYSIATSPVVYNKKELTKYRKAGHFFSALDAKTDTLIQPKHGFAGGVVMMAWKQGKKNEAGYINEKESKDKAADYISVITFAPATIDSINSASLLAKGTKEVFDFNNQKHIDSGMILSQSATINVSGLYINAKTTLSAEYLDGEKVKVASFKFAKTGNDAVTFNKNVKDDNGTVSFPINKNTAKAFKNIKDKEFYLILDNGTGLTSPKVKFTFETKIFE